MIISGSGRLRVPPGPYRGVTWILGGTVKIRNPLLMAWYGVAG